MQVHCSDPMAIFRKRPTFSFRFSKNGNLLSVSFSLKNLEQTQHKLDTVELCRWSSLGLEIQDQETASRRIELYSLKSLWYSLAWTAVISLYTATRMLTTHQVLSFPQASILSSTASRLVKFSSRVCTMATFLWARFYGHVSCIFFFFFFICTYSKNAGNVALVTPITTCIWYTWIGLLMFIYSFIFSIFFLSNSKTSNFCRTFLWGLQRWNFKVSLIPEGQLSVTAERMGTKYW